MRSANATSVLCGLPGQLSSPWSGGQTWKRLGFICFVGVAIPRGGYDSKWHLFGRVATFNFLLLQRPAPYALQMPVATPSSLFLGSVWWSGDDLSPLLQIATPTAYHLFCLFTAAPNTN